MAAPFCGKLRHQIKAGDHIICSNGLYGYCPYGFLEVLEEKFMITLGFCDMETETDIENKISSNLVLTPINQMKLIDFEKRP